jgi:inosine-uridine nucleoside N-ribohydrolase
MKYSLISAFLLLLPFAAHAAPVPSATANHTVKIILDTDIGDDIDDAYAVALVCSLPNVKLLGVTTTFGETSKRAKLAAKLLQRAGHGDIPVIAGIPGASKMGRQQEWAQDFHSSAIRKESAIGFMRQQILQAPGDITIIGIGALTNIAALITTHPELKSKIKSIVIMGGSVYRGYAPGSKPEPEWNIRCDPAAAKTVFTSGIPLTMAGLEVTAMMQLDAEKQKNIFAHGSPLTDALAALTALWGGGIPTLYDPVATAWALGYHFADAEKDRVIVEDDGSTHIVNGIPNCTVLINPRKDEFLDWYVQTVGK